MELGADLGAKIRPDTGTEFRTGLDFTELGLTADEHFDVVSPL